jgi:hypothetical protein
MGRIEGESGEFIMPYIGRPLNAGNLAVQSGTGDGSDTTPIATLDYSVGSSNSIGVYLDGVRQLAGTDFTASGTVLTFTTAPANGVGVDVYFLGLELSIPTPADRTVTLAKMATGTDGNIISYDASGNPVAIATGSNGQVLTSTGAGSPPAFEAVPAHTGNVAFPATQSASGDANTLDDYEEGTWTPRVSDSSNNATMSSAVGYYVKIGRVVHINCHIGTSSTGSMGVAVYVQDLPFTCTNNTSASFPMNISSPGGLNITAGHSLVGIIDTNTTNCRLQNWDNAAGTSHLTTGEWSANGSAYLSGHYLV